MPQRSDACLASSHAKRCLRFLAPRIYGSSGGTSGKRSKKIADYVPHGYPWSDLSPAQRKKLRIEDVFAYGQGQGKEALLGWFQTLNELRNRIAHPERGAVSDDEIALIETLMEHFDNLGDALPRL